MKRITSKEFYKRVEHLENVLKRELAVNIWDSHYSVFTKGPNNSQDHKLVEASNAREAVYQIDAILNCLSLQRKPSDLIVRISAKCSDLCHTQVIDKDNLIMEHDGYVPDFMPDEHYGDYVMLDIDASTGKILNWNTKPETVLKWAKEQGE